MEIEMESRKCILVNGIVGERMQLPMRSAKQRMDTRRWSLNTTASTVLMVQLSDFVRCPYMLEPCLASTSQPMPASMAGKQFGTEAQNQQRLIRSTNLCQAPCL